MKEVITMRNKTDKGVRLVSEPIVEYGKEYFYEIGFHWGVGKFFLEEAVTDLIVKWSPTFSKIIGYADEIQSLIVLIEKERGVKVVVDCPDLDERVGYVLGQFEKKKEV
jgi:hypothetical protein